MRPRPVRWYVLFTFSLLAYLSGALWITFSCVPKSTEKIYNIGQDQIDLLLNWGPIVCVVFIPVTTWLLTKRNGFNRTVFLGYFLTFVGSVVRTIPSMVPGTTGIHFRQGKGGLVLLHVGRILNATGGPITFGAATRMSADWFPEGQRTRATAIVFVSNNLGIAVTSIVGPYIVRWTSLAVLLYLLAGLSAIPMVCFLIYFPSSSAESVSRERETGDTEKEQSAVPFLQGQLNTQLSKADFLPGLIVVLKNYSAIILCLGAGIMGGIVNAYLGVLPAALNEVGESELQGDRINSITIFAGIVGGILLAVLTDRFFQRRLKDMLVFITITSFVFLFGLVYTVYIRSDLYWLQDVFALVAGFFQGACGPLTVEFAAELTYPADEGTSAGVYAFIFNIAALILIFVTPYISVVWVGVASLASVLLALLLFVTIKEQYKRKNATVLHQRTSIQTVGTTDQEDISTTYKTVQ